MNRHAAHAIVLMLVSGSVCAGSARAQVAAFPYREGFDSSSSLPAGWSSSRARNPAAEDFTVSTAAYRSPPHSVVATNATVSQYLESPPCDFRKCAPENLFFSLRRSSTFRAAVVCEAFFPGSFLVLGDTLRASVTGEYVAYQRNLPAELAGRDSVSFRWCTLRDSTGATGTLRIDDISVTALLSHDLAAVGLAFLPARPVAGEAVEAMLTVRNVGLAAASGFSLEYYLDADGDGTGSAGELKSVTAVSAMLQPYDSLIARTVFTGLPPGDAAVIACVVWNADLRPENNAIEGRVSVGFSPRSVVLNEILYAPRSGWAEWVEIFNTMTAPVDLRRWTISDRDASSPVPLTTASFKLEPRSYVVLCSDTSGVIPPGETAALLVVRGFPSLNNGGDVVCLRDGEGRVLDSLEYDPSWHNPAFGDPSGRSLERISPNLSSTDSRSWTTCLDIRGGTPGRENSVGAAAPVGGAMLGFSPNPFSPDEDGRDDAVLIRYAAPPGTVNMTLRVFDVRGRPVRRLLDNQPGGAAGIIVWDGRDDARCRAHIGVYVVLLECSRGGGESAVLARGVVVLAGKL